MADFDFFDQYRDKMRSLHPSESSAGEDWQALSQRLDATMPVAAPAGKRYRMAAAALLLLLLGSNLWWGFTFQRQNQSLEHLAGEVAQLKNTTVAAPKVSDCAEVNSLRKQVANLEASLGETRAALQTARLHPPVFAENGTGVFSKTASGIASGQTVFTEEMGQVAATANPVLLENEPAGSDISGEAGASGFSESEPPASISAQPEKLPFPAIALLETHQRRPAFLLENDLVMLPKMDKEDGLPFTKKIAKSFAPKTFRMGAAAGWLYPLDRDLKNQTGYSASLLAEVGFSRQLSLTAEWGRAMLHYKALAPDAALGLSSLPLPSPEHQFLEMDVSNQRLMSYGLGLRWKGLPQGAWHPSLSLGWSGIKFLPFTVNYEAELAGSIYKDMYHVAEKSGLKSYARLGVGVEFPLGKRLDWSLEGYYLHALEKAEPDMIGVRTGLSFIF